MACRSKEGPECCYLGGTTSGDLISLTWNMSKSIFCLLSTNTAVVSKQLYTNNIAVLVINRVSLPNVGDGNLSVEVIGHSLLLEERV